VGGDVRHSIFNGRDLSGWTPMNEGEFYVTNSNLHLQGGMGWLRTEREYTNFVFEAECRALQTNYNSGFFLRAGLSGKPFPDEVYQVNLKESALGSLMKGNNTVQASTTPGFPVGEWFKFRMEAHGRMLSLNVNGLRAWEFTDFDAEHGYVGIQAEGRQFDFRNLFVRELNGAENGTGQ
jgi:hypothetical protein